MLNQTDILQIIHELTNTDIDELDVNQNLIEAGILDSLTIISLIMKLEEICECAIPAELYEIDHFITINSILELTKCLAKD